MFLKPDTISQLAMPWYNQFLPLLLASLMLVLPLLAGLLAFVYCKSVQRQEPVCHLLFSPALYSLFWPCPFNNLTPFEGEYVLIPSNEVQTKKYTGNVVIV